MCCQSIDVQVLLARWYSQVEHWAKQFACTEFASDAALDNTISHAMHRALGFQETERVVYFKKNIS